MSDIVERLRQRGHENEADANTSAEAADTITRLTARVKELEVALVEAEKYNGCIQEVCIENEKLHKAVLKADRYLALNSPALAREELSAALSASQPAPHVLFTSGDADAPSAIKDRNGDVVLALCRNCGRGEIQLEEHPNCDASMKLRIDDEKFLAAVDRDGDHEVGAGALPQPAPQTEVE